MINKITINQSFIYILCTIVKYITSYRLPWGLELHLCVNTAYGILTRSQDWYLHAVMALINAQHQCCPANWTLLSHSKEQKKQPQHLRVRGQEKHKCKSNSAGQVSIFTRTDTADREKPLEAKRLGHLQRGKRYKRFQCDACVNRSKAALLSFVENKILCILCTVYF